MIRAVHILSLSVLSLMLLVLVSGCPEDVVEGETESTDLNAPSSILHFSAKAFWNRVELSWDIPTRADSKFNSDIRGIMVVRSEDKTPLALPYRKEKFSEGDLLGRGTVIYIGGDYGYIDDDVETGKTYYYEAIAFDEIPNYGESVLLNATPGSMITARIAHTQTLLDDGRVMLVGGIGYKGPLDTAEYYDPATEEFVDITNIMRTSRFDHTATKLADGRVLILGGYEEGFLDTLQTAEIFDPVTETFEYVKNLMAVGRASHSATLLENDTVLIVGGTDGFNAYTTMELFDPETLSFTPVENEMLRKRFDQTASSVMVGGEPHIMVVSGFDGFQTVPYAFFYNPADGTVADFAGDTESENSLATGRLAHTATNLVDGRVLIAGGFSGTSESGEATDVCEIFDTSAQTPFVVTDSLGEARSGHAAIKLNDDRVLIIGGIDTSLDILDTVEIFDPVTDTFGPFKSLFDERTVPAATLLDDGTVLVTGGNSSSNLFDPMPVSTAELYDPVTESFSVIGTSGK